MASLAELHETWTLMQFMDFMRGVLALNMPEGFDAPESIEDGGLIEGFALGSIGILGVPLALEGDPFTRVSLRQPELLERSLRDRSIEEVVNEGRDRERAFFRRLEALYPSVRRELAEELADADARARSGASADDQRAADRLRHNLARTAEYMDRIRERLKVLEAAGPFEPGATECGLDEGIDLSTEATMMADLEAFAGSCAQKQLIRFLRAAAFVSEVPAQLAQPGARMDAAVVQEVEVRVSSAVNAIAGLTVFFQKDPLLRRNESALRRRVRNMLDRALEGRTIVQVLREGEAAEHAFLPVLREELMRQLRSEMTERSDEAAKQGTAAPKRPSSRIRRLRADIERIDRRLDLLEASAPLDG